MLCYSLLVTHSGGVKGYVTLSFSGLLHCWGLMKWAERCPVEMASWTVLPAARCQLTILKCWRSAEMIPTCQLLREVRRMGRLHFLINSILIKDIFH